MTMLTFIGTLILVSAAGFSAAAAVKIMKHEIIVGLLFLAMTVGAVNMALIMASPNALTWAIGILIGLVVADEVI